MLFEAFFNLILRQIYGLTINIQPMFRMIISVLDEKAKLVDNIIFLMF